MSTLSRKVLLIALLAVLSAGAAPQETDTSPGSDPEPAADPSAPVKGVAGFSQVTPNLFRGGQPSQEGLEALAKMGVSIVVDGRLTGDNNEGKAVMTLGMRFVPLPWHCLRPKDEIFARFLALVRDNPDKKIFVHCRYGDDRTGMMIAAYRMAVQGWTWQEARKEMNAFGFHHTICASLVRYEKNFPSRLKNRPFRDLHLTPEIPSRDLVKPDPSNSEPDRSEPTNPPAPNSP